MNSIWKPITKLFQSPEVHLEATFQSVRVWTAGHEVSCAPFVWVLKPLGRETEKIIAVGKEFPSGELINARKVLAFLPEANFLVFCSILNYLLFLQKASNRSFIRPVIFIHNASGLKSLKFIDPGTAVNSHRIFLKKASQAAGARKVIFVDQKN